MKKPGQVTSYTGRRVEYAFEQKHVQKELA